jgi:hypothetical protein
MNGNGWRFGGDEMHGREETTGRRVFMNIFPFVWLLSVALAGVAVIGHHTMLCRAALPLAGVLTLVGAFWAGLAARGGPKLRTGCLFFGYMGLVGVALGAYEMGGRGFPESGSHADLILAACVLGGLVWLAIMQKVANPGGDENGAG